VFPFLLAVTSTAAFGANGFALGPEGGFRAIRIDDRGRAVAAGWSDRSGAMVARYLEDGSVDPSFRSDRARIGNSQEDRFHGLAIDPSGRIVAVGISGRRAVVARFLPDGSPDPDFAEFGFARGVRGKSFLHERADEGVDRFESVDLDADGRIVVSGVARGFRPNQWTEWFFCRWFDLRFCWSYENTSIVARFRERGPLDPSFGGAGFVLGNQGARWHVGPHDELLQTVVVERNRIAAAGWASGETYHDERTVVVRFLPDGKLDPSFATGGFELSPPKSIAGGGMEVLYGIARMGEKLVACGFSFDDSKHIRALTKTYDVTGKLIAHTLADARQLADSDIEYLVRCAIDAEGRIVAVGFTDDDWSTTGRYSEVPHRAFIARYRPFGQREGKFSSFADGRSLFGPKKEDGFYDVAIDRDGRIWVAGSASGRTLVARFNRDLTLDTPRMGPR
jgi:uncharacterized delta-60 repeat protein